MREINALCLFLPGEHLNQLITIATFTLPSELIVVRGRLESEGVECFTKDELTVQVHNFYSNAIGGVKLQVRHEDVELANQILTELGFSQESVSPHNRWDKMDKLTQNIPVVNKLRVEMRVLVVVAIFLFISLTAAFILTLQTFVKV